MAPPTSLETHGAAHCGWGLTHCPSSGHTLTSSGHWACSPFPLPLPSGVARPSPGDCLCGVFLYSTEGPQVAGQGLTRGHAAVVVQVGLEPRILCAEHELADPGSPLSPPRPPSSEPWPTPSALSQQLPPPGPVTCPRPLTLVPSAELGSAPWHGNPGVPVCQLSVGPPSHWSSRGFVPVLSPVRRGLPHARGPPYGAIAAWGQGAEGDPRHSVSETGRNRGSEQWGNATHFY